MMLQLYWQPTPGDTSPVGWFTIVFYLATALLAGVCALRTRQHSVTTHTQQERLVKWSFALLLLLLGLNKLTNFLSWFTTTGRIMAWQEGWYDVRRTFQYDLIVGIIIVALLLFGVLLFWLRQALRTQWLTLLSVLALAVFVIIRAVSLHAIDALLSRQLLGWRVNWLIELGLLLLVTCSLLLTSCRQR
ncbi:MAG: hypothetical protein R3C14_34650 [Caldilineaceae bacterium]